MATTCIGHAAYTLCSVNVFGRCHLRETDASHLEDSLVLGLDALQETRLREGKLCGGSLQVVVSLCLRYPFHKLRQVALQPDSMTSGSVTLRSPADVLQHH